MNRFVARLARGRAAFRAVAMLLVFALLTSITADLRHHAGHAGSSHASHMQTLVLDTEPLHIERGAGAQDQDQAASAASQQLDGQHQHGSGVPSCECCAATCLVLMHAGTATAGFPKRAMTTGSATSAAILPGVPQSLDRPPIASL